MRRLTQELADNLESRRGITGLSIAGFSITSQLTPERQRLRNLLYFFLVHGNGFCGVSNSRIPHLADPVSFAECLRSSRAPRELWP